MKKTGPVEKAATRKAIALYKEGKPAVLCAYLAGINPSTLYRALKRKEKR